MNQHRPNIDEELLARYIQDSTTDEDLRLIEAYCAQSVEHQKEMDDFVKLKSGIKRLTEMRQIDAAQALKKVKQRIGEHKGFGFYWQTIQKYVAIIALPLMLSTIYLLISNVKQESTPAPLVEIYTPETTRSQFTLPDGTKVWLHSNSKLSYPSEFKEDERLVQLDGEAFFEVAHNANKPFFVQTANGWVQAIGTQFNCCSSNNRHEFETVLTEGKVNMWINVDGNRKLVTQLSPNERFTYNKQTNTFAKTAVNADKYIAWREGVLMFKNDDLEDVLKELERWYNVKFNMDKSLKDQYAFTGTFTHADLSQILEFIQLTTPVVITEESHPQLQSTIKINQRVISLKKKEGSAGTLPSR